ncbi:peptidase dimerization domain-containing protein (plasmid) [Ensifer sp. D2-11]
MSRGRLSAHAGMMRGGTALNFVPNRCEIDFEIRNIAEDDPRDILARIKADASAIASRHHTRFPTACIEMDEVLRLSRPECRARCASSKIVAANPRPRRPGVESRVRHRSRRLQPRPGHFHRHLRPRLMDNGRKPDEFVSADQLRRCYRMIARLVDELHRFV